MVEGSIGCAGSAWTTAGSQSVSATVALVKPASATMSPASASSTGSRSRPRKPRILVTRVVSISSPSRERALSVAFAFRRPEVMRPVSRRPR